MSAPPDASLSRTRDEASTLPPVLALLERFLLPALNPALSSGTSGASLLKNLTLTRDGLVLHLALPGWLPTGKDSYPLRLRIEDTGPLETVFRLEFPAAPGLGKVLDWGMKKLPDTMLNELLRKIFRNALHKRGELMVLDHQALLQSGR